LNDIAISRLLSVVLRHRPDKIGITLDAGGWAEIDVLLRCLDDHGTRLTRDHLLAIVASSDKQRFAISDDGARIRANQGHSLEVELGVPPCEPPDTLYHGTAMRFLERIRAEGLRRGERQYVHLSINEEIARLVGERHGQAIVLTVDARSMHAAGELFYLAANEVWLTDQVAPQYLQFPES
jgi:putative RNA 2'-phosphotransferase